MKHEECLCKVHLQLGDEKSHYPIRFKTPNYIFQFPREGLKGRVMSICSFDNDFMCKLLQYTHCNNKYVIHIQAVSYSLTSLTICCK